MIHDFTLDTDTIHAYSPSLHSTNPSASISIFYGSCSLSFLLDQRHAPRLQRDIVYTDDTKHGTHYTVLLPLPVFTVSARVGVTIVVSHNFNTTHYLYSTLAKGLCGGTIRLRSVYLHFSLFDNKGGHVTVISNQNTDRAINTYPTVKHTKAYPTRASIGAP